MITIKTTTFQTEVNLGDLCFMVHADLTISTVKEVNRSEHFGFPAAEESSNHTIEINSFAATLNDEDVEAKALLRPIRLQLQQEIEDNWERIIQRVA